MSMSQIIKDSDKDKILKSKTYDDALIKYELIKLGAVDDDHIELLKTYIDKKRYIKKIDHEQFMLYLEILDGICFKNDAMFVINDIKGLTDDPVQLRTVDRILRHKQKKLITDNNKFVTKTCPHCSKKSTCLEDTVYVVCGYGVRGFDWKGCGRDWCFQCEKKLCKSWNIDMLYNPYNRLHNHKCCKIYAHKSSDDYKNNFCFCNSDNVKR